MWEGGKEPRWNAVSSLVIYGPQFLADESFERIYAREFWET